MEVNDVVKKKVSEILLDPDNPNVMTEDEMQRLRNSMEKYGFLFPIIIDQKNQIVDGEHRYRIFKEKGLKEIPCIQMHFKSEAEKRVLRQAANKIHGTHDLEKDIKELDYIFRQDKKLLEDMLGMNQKHLDDMKNALHLIEPKFQKPSRTDEEVQDIMNKMDIKHVIHIPVSEELVLKIKAIMADNGLDDYEELIIFLISNLEQ